MNLFNFSLADWQQGMFWALIYGVWFGMVISLFRWFIFGGLKK